MNEVFLVLKDINMPSKEQLAEFSKRHHIRKLALFGSILREDFGPDSDIDVLIEFEAGHIPGLFDLMKMEEELSNLFGRNVDLRTPQDLSRYFRDEVLEKAEVQYLAS
ncbi:nucleotidyltransferase [Candidatus Thorarchaeota archaeon]|nr:MAG: nucleotidyltransferase [Candidatus Thorarchaeota archaeon]